MYVLSLLIECKKTNTFTDQQFRRKTQHLGGDEKRDLLEMERRETLELN